MERTRILLLRPSGDHPSAMDQSQGARLTAIRGPLRDRIVLEEAAFRDGDLAELEQAARRWAGKVAGIVGATGVTESTHLGKIAQQLGLLCFVSNNNPVVWQAQTFVFHIGVPTGSTSPAIADLLTRKVGARRIYILHDRTAFQREAARATVSSLMSGGAKVRCHVGGDASWLDDVKSWAPELVYLVYSDEALALPLAKSLRGALRETLILFGRSLLRHTFLTALGKDAEGLLFVDIFHRSMPRTGQEAALFQIFNQTNDQFPTANHGFGWDAMTLCRLALTKGNGHLSLAIEYLESGVEIEGATGRYRFSRGDHNGRATFNPTTLSQVRNGQLKMFEASR